MTLLPPLPHAECVQCHSAFNPAPTAGCKMLASRHTWTAMTKWPAECPGTSVPRMPWRYKCYTDPRVVKKDRAKIRGTSRYRWTKSWHSSSGQSKTAVVIDLEILSDGSIRENEHSGHFDHFLASCYSCHTNFLGCPSVYHQRKIKKKKKELP